jgi:hypothetical protein
MIQFRKILSAASAITPLVFGAVLVTMPSAPVAAQSVVFNQEAPYRVSQPQMVGSFIYGSPIPTPMPVDPVTGFSVRRTPLNSWNSTPTRRTGTVVNSTLVNPVLVNPTIRDSTLINPVILNSGYRRVNIPSRVIVVPY